MALKAVMEEILFFTDRRPKTTIAGFPSLLHQAQVELVATAETVETADREGLVAAGQNIAVVGTPVTQAHKDLPDPRGKTVMQANRSEQDALNRD